MADSVYNTAHKLAKNLKNSEQYQKFKEAEQKLIDNDKSLEMFKNMRRIQMQIQSKNLKGEKIGEKEKKKMEELQKVIEHHPGIREYMEAEQRLFVLYNDIMKIIGDALDFELIDENNPEMSI